MAIQKKVRLDQETFDSLNLTEEEVMDALSGEPLQEYERTGTVKVAQKGVRDVLLPILEKRIQDMGIESNEKGKSLVALTMSKVTSILTRDRLEGFLGKDENTKAKDRRVYQSLVNRLYSGILYEGRKLEVEDFITGIDSTKISRNLKRDRITSTYLINLINKELEGKNRDIVSVWFDSHSSSHKAIVDGLIAFNNQQSAKRREGISPVVAIRDDILTFMGSTSKKILDRKDTIYNTWKQIEGRFDGVKKQSEIVKKQFGLEDNHPFAKATADLENYVVEYSPVSVKRANPELVALDLLDAFMKRSGRNVFETDTTITMDSVGAPTVVEESRTETDKLDEQSQITRKEIEAANKGLGVAVDPISRYYMNKMLGGAFMDGRDTERIIDLLKDYSKRITFGKRDYENLDKFIADIPNIAGASTDKVFLPIHFSRGFLDAGDNKMDSKIDPINKIWREYFMALGGLIEQGYRMPKKTKQTSNIGTIGEDFKSAGAKITLNTYVAQFQGRPMNFKETSKEQADALKELFVRLELYMFSPLSNPFITLGYNFKDIKKTSSYKIMSVYADKNNVLEGELTQDENKNWVFAGQPFETKTEAETARSKGATNSTKAISTLYQLLDKRGGSMITNKQIKIIEDFLESLRVNVEVESVKTQTNKLYKFVIRRLYKKAGKGFLDRTREGLGRLVASVFNKINETGSVTTLGVDSADFKGEDYDIDDVVALLELKDFLAENADRLNNQKKAESLVGKFNQISKANPIKNKILQAHDSFRILKGLPIYYGRGQTDSVEDLSKMIDVVYDKMGIHIVGNEIVKMVEEIDSFTSIATNVGVTEEVVYFVKANFR